MADLLPMPPLYKYSLNGNYVGVRDRGADRGSRHWSASWGQDRMKVGGECIWRGKEMERALPRVSEFLKLVSNASSLFFFFYNLKILYFKKLKKYIFPLRLLQKTEQNSVCLLVIYFKYNGMYMSIPNSQSLFSFLITEKEPIRMGKKIPA